MRQALSGCPEFCQKLGQNLGENYLHQSCMDVVEIDIFSVPITFILPSSYEWSGNGEIMIRQLSSGCLTAKILPSINALSRFLLSMNFEKYHALGNDYLVYDPRKINHSFTEKEIIRICHRNFGLGSDGILVGPLPSNRADFGLQILNPDGSEAEKSGNGLRIFARYLRDAKLVGENTFSVDTLGGVVSCEVSKDVSTISVEMGQVSFHSDIIPVSIAGDPREVLEENIVLSDTNFSYYGATIGNPHCVVPVDELNDSLAKKYGAELENHPNFPNRTNVQFLKILDRNRIKIEIWERGAGYTLASGSSSSAAGAVARKMGACDADITVEMPGGEIQLHIDDQFNVLMKGPATRVGQMILDDECLLPF